MKRTLENIILIILLVGIFYIIISSSQKVFISSYDIDSSEPIEIETINAGMRNMSQSITFKDKSGVKHVLDNLRYDGVSNPENIYIYRIGRYEWSKFIRWPGHYDYYATDKYAGEIF